MESSRIKVFWQAVSVMMGTIIGAGIMGIPYVVAKVGLLPGLSILLVLGLAVMLVHLMIAEMMLRTRERHQIPGLINRYLGKIYKFIDAAGIIFGAYGALTAYIIGEGQVWATLLGDQSRPWLYSGLFVLIGVLVLFFGLKLVKLIDEWLLALVVIIIVVIAVLCWPAVNPINYQTVNWSNSFIGYGVLLFALSGTNAIFSVREVLKNREKMIKPAIITGSLLPMFLYALFAVAVVGVTGSATTEIATIGLGSALGSRMIILCNLFAAITMFTSFCAIGLSLKQMYYHDYGLPAWLAWILVISVPPIIFFLVSPDFIKVIGLAGAVTFGLSGVLIVAAYWRSKKHGDKSPAFSLPKFYSIGGLIILMFVLGIIYSLVTWKA